MLPKLSICVPSRNRQIYFQETIRALTSSSRTEIEFVFADNSDDPSIMKTFMANYEGDPRVVFLPPADTILSMVDNWERTVAASTGDWVTVIGDDDYLDPELVVLLQRLVAVCPDLEALDWIKLHYTWPMAEEGPPINLNVPLTCGLVDVSPELNRRRAWLWQEATHNLVNGFSIYHAALSRSLLETIKKTFGGRYFEHPTVDFDSAFKVSLTAKRLMASERPFSVFGACPLSNSASLHKLETLQARHREFMSDLGRNLDDDPELADLPFRSTCGVAAAVAQTQHWIKKRYGLKFEGWERNFVGCCVRSCEKIRDRALFEQTVLEYRHAFSRWQGGRFLSFFNPAFFEAVEPYPDYEPYSGILDGKVYLSLKLLNPRTPAEFFHAANGIMATADDIELKWHQIK